MLSRYRCMMLLLVLCYLNASAQPTDSMVNAISILHEQNHFDQQFEDPWYLTSLQYARKTKGAVWIGKINHANRFGSGGLQYEAEAYPKLGKKFYAYVAVAYSNDVPVFSKWRSGISLFIPAATGWEAEAGFRLLYFNDNIWIGTAGLSKYAGMWLINIRSFLSFNNPTQDVSVFLNARKYFKNEADYFWLQVGRGVSPDESRSIQLNTSEQLTSNRISSGIKFSLSKHIQMLFSAGWSADRYAPAKEGNQYFGSAGLEFRFR